ncbi:MAG: class I SAM-dependent methyltransferase [Kineosporiaceae bacterium]
MRGTPQDYFDRVYAAAPQPWPVDGWYETRKRGLLLAALPEPRYERAVEPGCGVGALTVELAGRCGSVVAVERSTTAADAARAAVHGLPGVEVRPGVVPQDWPEGEYDLAVLSEIGYYTDTAGWSALLDRAVAGLDPGGTLASVHWRHPAPDHVTSGDTVHAVLRERPDLTIVSTLVEDDLRLDVLVKAPAGTRGLSVAVRTRVPGAVG